MFIDKTWFSKTPSIAIQRIILLGFFVAVGAIAWWQHSFQTDNYLVRKFEATPLPDGVADIDFGAAEAAWSELIVSPEGTLEINAQAELALSEVIALMSEDTFDLYLDRMSLLIEKQLGTAIREELAALLPALKNYKDMEQRWWEDNGSRLPPPYEELFALQDEVLGETLASQLFSEQRRVANMMLAGYHIHNDSELTQEQKDRALADLQSRFEVGGAHE